MTGGADFTIRALRVIDGPANQSGNRLLAAFDIEIAGLFIIGCALILGEDGLAVAKGPAGKAYKGPDISTRFVDPALAREITRRSSEIYQLFTGRKLETE